MASAAGFAPLAVCARRDLPMPGSPETIRSDKCPDSGIVMSDNRPMATNAPSRKSRC